MNRFLSVALILFGAAVAASTSHAQVSGSMQVQLNLVEGCIVSGSSDPLNAVNFGVMNFGTAPTLFADQLEAQAMISGSPTRLQCSPGASLSILVGDGANASGGVRRLAAGGGYVQYRLFTQAAGAGTEYPVGDGAPGRSISIPPGGAAFDLPVHGLIAPQSGLTAGAYTDTVTVTLNF